MHEGAWLLIPPSPILISTVGIKAIQSIGATQSVVGLVQLSGGIRHEQSYRDRNWGKPWNRTGDGNSPCKGLWRSGAGGPKHGPAGADGGGSALGRCRTIVLRCGPAHTGGRKGSGRQDAGEVWPY